MRHSSYFERVVCCAAPVRTAFDGTLISIWWKIVLSLHGKPIDTRRSDSDRIACLTAGFQFYSALYAGLGGVFLIVAALFGGFHADLAGLTSRDCSAGAAITGIYLGCTAKLGFQGSIEMSRRNHRSISILIVFMVMIMMFLAGACSALSLIIAETGTAATYLNLSALSLVFTVGVGSYFIEIVYLATDGNSLLSNVSIENLPHPNHNSE